LNQGFERITANTMENNIPAQKALEKPGFILEGRERKATYFRRKKFYMLNYSLLTDEYIR
jgi:RimJ/RimL family protein N-acetyltransferase